MANKNKIVQHILPTTYGTKKIPHKIMNQMIFLINQLLPVSFYAIDQQLSSDQISSKLGKHPFLYKKIHGNLKKTQFTKN